MTTRRISTPIRIDFTPFIAVSIVLILFFVWVKTLQRPVIMGVTVPSGCRKYESLTYPRKVVALVLLAKDRIGVMQYWHGDDIVELQQTNFGSEGLHTLLEAVKRSANGDVAVTIKSTQLATFRNVRAVLEELRRVGIPYLLPSELTRFDQRRLSYYEQMFIDHRLSINTVFLQIPPYYSALEKD